jgi:hypothetical protein
MSKQKQAIYFGILELPKGKRRPSMKEAIDASQVRYFGINKIDKVIVEAKAKKELQNSKKEKEELFTKIAAISGKIKKLSGNLKLLKTKTEISKANGVIVDLENKKKDLLDKYRKLT